MILFSFESNEFKISFLQEILIVTIILSVLSKRTTKSSNFVINLFGAFIFSILGNEGKWSYFAGLMCYSCLALEFS